MDSPRSRAGRKAISSGTNAEQLARFIFGRWGWVVAKPEPDLGTDVIVELPSDVAPEAASIVVQVRSHQKAKATETIKRSSAFRLRDGVLPAFLLSLDWGKRQLHWVYLDPLFDRDERLRSGGNLVVSLAGAPSFEWDQKTPPPEFLAAVLRAKRRGALKAAPTIRGFADAMEERYRELDDRLVVRPLFDGVREVLTLAARRDPVTLHLDIVRPTQASQDALRAAFEWGRSAVIDAESLQLRGSSLLDYLRQQVTLTKLHIEPEPVLKSRGQLTVQRPDGTTGHEIVDVHVTRGSHGGEMAMRMMQGFMTVTVRLGHDFKSWAELRFDIPAMRQWTLQDCRLARRAINLLNCVGDGARVVVELDAVQFDEPLVFWWAPTPGPDWERATLPARAATALLDASEALRFSVPGHPMADPSETEMEDWMLAADLLHGRSVDGVPKSFSLEWTGRPKLPKKDEHHLTIALRQVLSVMVAGQEVAEVPFWLRFHDYRCSLTAFGRKGGWRMICTPTDTSMLTHLPDSPEPPFPSVTDGRH